MSAYKDFTKANEAYVATFGDKGELPLPPAKKLLIGTFRPSVTSFIVSQKLHVLFRGNSHLHGCAYQVRPPRLRLHSLAPLNFSCSVYAELGIQEGEAHIVRNAGGVA